MNIKQIKDFSKSADLLIIPVFKEDLKSSPANFPKVLKDFISKRSKNFKAKKLETLSTFDLKDLPEQTLLIGMGDRANIDVKTVLYMAGKAGSFAKKNDCKKVEVLLNKEFDSYIQQFLEGFASSQYDLGKLKNKRKEVYSLSSLSLYTNSTKFKEQVSRAKAIIEAMELVKDLVNQPANIITSDYLANTAKKVAKDNDHKFKLYSNKELKEKGFGGILAVNAGSRNSAYCAVMEYNGGKKDEAPIVIVGKGMVFDSGGYSIKLRSMHLMQQDMAGAATIIGVMSAIKKLGLKKNVVGITPIAENMVNENAYRPSDIITMLSGDTVEVTNTDAEGRLILADALHLGTSYKPKSMATIATLTGAVGTALGPRYCGIMGNDENMRNQMQEAGNLTDDWAWPLPVPKNYKDKMKSKVADLKNHDLSSAQYAGTAKAAGFLENFVGGNSWCHIDIGGTAFAEDPKPYQTLGATSHGLRLLIKFLEDYA